MRKPLTADDAAYLQEYVNLCDAFLGGSFQLEDAEKKLEELNKTWKVGITNKVRKHRIMGSNLTDYEGWVPSAVC